MPDYSRRINPLKKYLPLILIESYLGLTLLILFFGPIKFRLHNFSFFLIYIFLYHFSFVVGYLLGLRQKNINRRISRFTFSSRYFAFLFIFGLVTIVGSLSNLVIGIDFSPSGFYQALVDGFLEPGLVYTERMANLDSSLTAVSGNRFFNSLSVLFAFSQFLFIYYSIYFWTDLGRKRQLLFVLFSLLFCSLSVLSGTNSPVFYYFIFVATSLISILYIRRDPRLFRVLLALSTIFLVPILIFGSIMSQRGGAFDYFQLTSPLGDIASPSSHLLGSLDDTSVVYLFFYSLVWLNYYLVQGYYGFSLILNLDHYWTFGFGNSAFLQRQSAVLFGFDPSSITFQARISHLWDQSAQWHSFYGQFANDFGFEGLVFFMFLLGFAVSRIWMSAVSHNSFYASALVPIYAIMFIFFPANNQIFGVIGFLSYFIVVSLLWLFETGKIRWGPVNS